MNTNLFEAIKQIVVEHGESVLDDPRRVSDLLAAAAKDEPKSQRNAFVKCLEDGFVPILKTANEQERTGCQKQLAQKLAEEEGFESTLCEEALDLLVNVLFNAGTIITCKGCGAETQILQENIGWLDKLVVQKNVELARVTTEKNRSDTINRTLTEKLDKRETGLVIVSIVGVIVLALHIYTLYDTWPRPPQDFFAITEIQFGNIAEDNTWLSEPGSLLSSSEMRLLAGRVTYNSNFEGRPVLHARTFNPLGEMVIDYWEVPAGAVPDGYTRRFLPPFNYGTDQSFLFFAWRSSEYSEFSPGVWTVELWHNNVLAASREVTIHP